jgi:hypothetical protein
MQVDDPHPLPDYIPPAWDRCSNRSGQQRSGLAEKAVQDACKPL